MIHALLAPMMIAAAVQAAPAEAPTAAIETEMAASAARVSEVIATRRRPTRSTNVPAMG